MSFSLACWALRNARSNDQIQRWNISEEQFCLPFFVDRGNADVLDDLTLETKKTRTKLAAAFNENEHNACQI